MKCSEKACPFPGRSEGLCAKHLRDRTLESSVIGGSIPLMQEYALANDYTRYGAGNGMGPGGGARHLGPRSTEL
jgi:hypothetical protein